MTNVFIINWLYEPAFLLERRTFWKTGLKLQMFLTKTNRLIYAYMDLIITQQDTLIWCRFINIDLSAFHKETDIVHCMIQGC